MSEQPSTDFSVPRRTPFRRALMKVKELAYIFSRPSGERELLLLKLKPYKGRGKNYNYPFVRKIENRAVNTSKYSPHQGKQEIARRRVNATLLP